MSLKEAFFAYLGGPQNIPNDDVLFIHAVQNVIDQHARGCEISEWKCNGVFINVWHSELADPEGNQYFVSAEIVSPRRAYVVSWQVGRMHRRLIFEFDRQASVVSDGIMRDSPWISGIHMPACTSLLEGIEGKRVPARVVRRELQNLASANNAHIRQMP